MDERPRFETSPIQGGAFDLSTVYPADPARSSTRLVRGANLPTRNAGVTIRPGYQHQPYFPVSGPSGPGFRNLIMCGILTGRWRSPRLTALQTSPFLGRHTGEGSGTESLVTVPGNHLPGSKWS